MTPLDALFVVLERTPDDWVARAALADCFEEAGNQTAADCLRWTLARKLRPSPRLSFGAFWFDGSRPAQEYTDRDAYLPGPLFAALADGLDMLDRRFYESPREAEEDLFAAFAAAVAGGWSPD